MAIDALRQGVTLKKLFSLTVPQTFTDSLITLERHQLYFDEGRLTMTMQTEQDQRINILNSVLTSPHRDVQRYQKIHEDLVKNDPLFYQQLAAWYNDNGDIRDHKQLFVSNLLVSDFEPHRDVGLALFRQLPPYQVTRVMDCIKKDLKRNLPRSVKTEVERYLRERENDSAWFDSSALTARKHLKRMYALCHIAPSERAQSILFDEKPPEDSSLAAIKELRKASSPSEQAAIILENKIPYRVASTVVDQLTPTVLYALIDVMSPQELINNIGSLKARGALNNDDLRTKIEAKLEKAKKAKNVSALKSMEAIKNVGGLDEKTTKALADVADSQVKKKGRIKLPTALLVDKSASMRGAIEMGKRVGSMISSAMADGVDFYCYAFDTMPYVIDAGGKTLQDWNKAFQGIMAGGGTHNGAPILYMLQKRQRVEKIVMITDEGENGTPTFGVCLQRYAQEMGITPSVFVIRIGDAGFGKTDKITRALRYQGVEVEDYEPQGDYYSEPQILTFLSKNSKLELLMEIMGYELPKRKPN